MKRNLSEFLRRGVIAGGFGPLVLAILYWILQRQDAIQTLTVQQVCLGIISLYALAFIVGGMNIIYQVEQLPLMVAILIHGCTLYVSYLITYLLNGWLEWGILPIVVFSGIFIVGYLVIWAIIYTVTKKRTTNLNEKLHLTQQRTPRT